MKKQTNNSLYICIISIVFVYFPVVGICCSMAFGSSEDALMPNMQNERAHLIIIDLALLQC